jgi:hypothetical protein
MVKKEFTGKVRVDSKIEALIPPLEKEQLKILEESLLAEGGSHSPLWLWGDLLVDGHHRYKLCKKHKLWFDMIQVYEDAETIEEVEYRIKRDAIGQRNMTPGAQSKFRAEMVAYHIKNGSKKRAAVKTVAAESEVSIRKVYRDVERAELVETIDDEVKPATANMSTPAVKKLASLPKPKQKAAAKRAGGDGKKLEKEIKQDTPAEAAAKVKNIAHQHRDKLVRAIDDYHQHKPNAKERDRLVKVTQNVSLW